MRKTRTDLIIEADSLEAGTVVNEKIISNKNVELRGVAVKEVWNAERSIKITTVQIRTEDGAKAMERPIGTYITMELPELLQEEEELKEKAEKELEKQLEELDRQILLEKSKQSFEISKQDLEQFFIQALKLEPKLLIDYLVKEIKVYEDKLEIFFNSPIIKSPDNNQGFFLFSFNSKLPKFIQNKERPIMIDIQIRVYI